MEGKETLQKTSLDFDFDQLKKIYVFFNAVQLKIFGNFLFIDEKNKEIFSLL